MLNAQQLRLVEIEKERETRNKLLKVQINASAEKEGRQTAIELALLEFLGAIGPWMEAVSEELGRLDQNTAVLLKEVHQLSKIVKRLSDK